MPNAERRHLLVIASQCPSAPTLEALSSAASGLDAVLRDLGECIPGLRDGRSLLHGTLNWSVVVESVKEAIDYADDEEAVLVLAFLGHAFTPPKESRLYYMVDGSRDQQTDGAVDVNGLIAGAANRSNIGGVVVIADACYAGAATASTASVVAGVRAGCVRLAMLMAASSQQPAYDLALSRGIGTVLRDGVPNAQSNLAFGDIKTAIENRRLAELQELACLDFDGARGGRRLWLARNRLSPQSSALGPAVVGELLQVVGPLLDQDLLPVELDRSALTEIRARLREIKPATIAVQEALGLVGDIGIGLTTAEFLRTWLGAELTTERLRRALVTVDRPLWQDPAIGLGDALGHLALTYPPADTTCGRMMARCVAALCLDAGRNPADREPQDWAQAMLVTEHFNDAVQEFGDRWRTRRLRVIVRLQDPLTDRWPSEVEAWLQNGDERIGHKIIKCEERTETATGKALTGAVRWAKQLTRALGLRLDRVEVAAHESALLNWRPEEVTDGELLGVDHMFSLRWGKRLNPPADLEWINDKAWTKLTAINATRGDIPADWLTRRNTDDMERLARQLSRGMFGKALCVDHVVTDSALLALLMAHSPIVLWPRSPADLIAGHRDAVQESWHKLPDAFHEAYRAEWREDPADPLAALRTVWDDAEWLSFCDHFNQLSLGVASNSRAEK